MGEMPSDPKCMHCLEPSSRHQNAYRYCPRLVVLKFVDGTGRDVIHRILVVMLLARYRELKDRRRYEEAAAVENCIKDYVSRVR